MKLFTSLLLLVSSISIYAQDSTAGTSINDLYIDYTVPNFSAFSLLDVDGDEIVRPGNIKQLAAGVGNFVGSNKKINTGLALEISPRAFGKVRNTEWWNKKYHGGNFAFSFATANDDSLGAMFAGGFKWVPFDLTDPFGNSDFYDNTLIAVQQVNKDFKKQSLANKKAFNSFLDGLFGEDFDKSDRVKDNTFDFSNGIQNPYADSLRRNVYANPVSSISKILTAAITKEGKAALSATERTELITIAEKFVAQIKAETEIEANGKLAIIALKERYKNENWYKSSFMFSAGVLANSRDQSYEGLKFRNGSAIISSAFGFEMKPIDKYQGQLLIQGKIDGAFIDTVDYSSRFSFGGRYIVGNAENRLSAELLYSSSQLKSDFVTSTYNQIRYLRYSLGLEIKISNGTWLELAIGGQQYFEGSELATQIIPKFGFKHALQNQQRRFK